MDRADFLNFEQVAGPARRSLVAPLELRAEGDQTVVFRGYASTTETPYDVYGGTFPGWVETMARGAFKRTIKNHADVQFSINHEGMALAKTSAGSLKLSEDQTGLLTEARMNRKVSAVNDLYELAADGNMSEMSFGFKVVADEWRDQDGEPADKNTGSQRRILEVNMNRGDVSAVNFGANPTTSGGFRDEMFLAELRDGRIDVDVALEQLVGRFEERSMVTSVEMQLQRIEQAVNELRAMYVTQNATDAQGTPLSWQNSDSEPLEQRAAADINNLPDSAFAYIEPGGKKDAEGKTTPRSLRHFPIHDAAHVQNALARMNQSPFGPKAKAKIMAAAKKFGIGTNSAEPDQLLAAYQALHEKLREPV